MTLKYYLKNIFWAGFILACVIYNFLREQQNTTWLILLIFSIFNFILYPYSKLAIETLTLKFTSRDFWHKGVLMETPAKNGVYVIYYLFCFVVAIPFGLPFLTFSLFSKKAA